MYAKKAVSIISTANQSGIGLTQLTRPYHIYDLGLLFSNKQQTSNRGYDTTLLIITKMHHLNYRNQTHFVKIKIMFLLIIQLYMQSYYNIHLNVGLAHSASL